MRKLRRGLAWLAAGVLVGVLTGCGNGGTEDTLGGLEGSVRCAEITEVRGTDDSVCWIDDQTYVLAWAGGQDEHRSWVYANWDEGYATSWVFVGDVSLTTESADAALEIWHQLGGTIVLPHPYHENDAIQFCSDDITANEQAAEAMGDPEWCSHIPGARG